MLWIRDWELCRTPKYHNRPKRVVALKDRSSTVRGLPKFKQDAFKMRAMRAFLPEVHSTWEFSSMSDDAMIDQVVELLVWKRLGIFVSGCLHKHVLFEQIPLSAVSLDIPPIGAPFPLSERRRPEVNDPVLITHPPTLSDIDSAQAEALGAAASQGIPFCPE
jgi:hypothetical protein